MALDSRCHVAAPSGVAVRLDTRRPASYGRPMCRERATCVPDRGPRELPDGRRGSSSVPDFGPNSPGSCSIRADRIWEGKKRLCCVTTRRRNRRVRNGLRRGLGPLAAHALSLGVLGFDLGVLAMFGLPPRRLPMLDLP
jgi:hypothetical protein